MITTNELRIGNLVQDENRFIFKVEDISENYVIAHPTNKDYSIALVKGGGVRMRPKPIDLNIEQLLKCGFGYQLKEKCFERLHLRLRSCGCDGYSVYIGFSVAYGQKWRDINVQVRHIHQLQNLYYALTGGELEIKL